MDKETEFFSGPNRRIAYRRLAGAGPTVVWLGGFKSDMTGTKAEAFRNGRRTGAARFSASITPDTAHRRGGSRMERSALWLADALAAIDALTAGPLVLVGSSMGGWIAALAALQRKERLAGIVFIAPAPDFTEELIWNEMTGAERDIVMRAGRIVEHSPYSTEPTIITRALIEDGRNHLILGGDIDIRCPVRILQGMDDPDVPWRHALKFAERLASDNTELILLKKGDHRLSKPHEIAKIIGAIEEISSESAMTACG